MINNRYSIIKKIGEGRSKVFLANDAIFNSIVAIKVLPSSIDSAEKKAFRQEYFYIKKFDHPNIIKVLDYGNVVTLSDAARSQFEIEYNSQFITLEYFEGITLNNVIDDLNKTQIESIIYFVSSVLFYLHQSNFIYYDLKPENILIKIINDKVDVKFIDFGLTRHLFLDNSKNIMGSIKFIAPEVLNREARNHKADLYSLGVLLYRIIYKKYPIEYEDPLKIYKTQIEGKLDFPNNNVFPHFTDITKKLLNKNSGNRPSSSFDVISQLAVPLLNDFSLRWNSPKIFSGRRIELEQCIAYLDIAKVSRPIKLVGQTNSGKTFFIKELQNLYEKSILMTPDSFHSDKPVSIQILSQFYFNFSIASQLSEEIKTELENMLKLQIEIPMEEFRSIITSISKRSKIILLIDNIESFRPLEVEMIDNILPILIVNGGKLVWTAKVDTFDSLIRLQSIEEIELKPYSKNEVLEFIDLNYAYFLPKDKISELVQKHSNFQPGDIEKFIEDLVHHNILTFEKEKGFIFLDNTKIQSYLNKSLVEIYSEHFEKLTETEKFVLAYLSLFQNNYSINSLNSLFGLTNKQIEEIFNEFEKKDIGNFTYYKNSFEFYSPGLKLFVISRITDVKLYHKKIGCWLELLNQSQYNYDIAFHYEQAEEIKKSLDYYLIEIEKAKKTSANNHLINLLNHVLTLPIDPISANDLKFELSKAYYLIGDMNACYSITDELLDQSLPEELETKLLIQKGNTQINLGEHQNGISTLKNSMKKVSQPNLIDELNVSIAGASLYHNMFDETSAICSAVINSDSASNLSIGQAYNLLGLVELYKNQNLELTINYFLKSADYYVKENDNLRLAGANLNIGNIYVMMHEYDKAKHYWDRAIEINDKIGNLDQEGLALLNYGILDYDLNEFEEAIKKYERAKLIFENLGKRNSTGLAYNNLAEVHLMLCNFNSAIEYIEKAQYIFEEIKSYTELGETLFLKGIIYYKLNDSDEVNRIINLLKQFISKELLPEKFILRVLRLEALHNIIITETFNAIVKINELLDKLSSSDEREDNYIYAASIFNLINLYIHLNKFENAEELVNNKKLSEIAENNNLISTERDYWTAKIKFDSKTEDPFNMIQKALINIENKSITELTWKVMFLAGLYFSQRGNKVNSEKYFQITKALILNIEKSIPTKDSLQKFQQLQEIAQVRRLCL
jgi:serine/threonine protein kinase